MGTATFQTSSSETFCSSGVYFFWKVLSKQSEMKTRSSLSRIAMVAAVACLFLSSAEARTVAQKKQAARSQFDAAERLREALSRKLE